MKYQNRINVLLNHILTLITDIKNKEIRKIDLLILDTIQAKKKYSKTLKKLNTKHPCVFNILIIKTRNTYLAKSTIHIINNLEKIFYKNQPTT